MNTKKLTKLLALYLPYILLGLVATNFGEAWRLAEGKELGERIMSMMGTLPAAFANPLPSLHPLDLLIGISCGAGLRLAVYLRSKNAKKYRHGMEYGSARWGTAKDIEPFQAPKFEDNIILTKTERLMMSNRPSDPKNARNKNVLIVGGSGSGKTRFWLKPNLLQMHSSYVVTDPKGSIVVECGNALLKNGYKLKILNTINFSKSMHYNPFSYVHSEKDILKLVTTLMTNTKGDGSGGDPFWEKSERLLLTALIAYLHYEAPKEEQNFSTLLEMLNTMQVSEDDEDFQNPVDLLFEDLAKRKPNSFAGRQYKLYKLAAGKTAKSILISCGARLAPFDIQELRDRTMYDELELDMLGDRKTALFLIMSDTDSTFNFLISMVYTQLFNLLCDKADDKYGGKLPVHVRCLIDECANIGQIPNLEKLVATIRSREISACLVLQARSQLKAIYKDNADTIVGNMDSQIFLGGSEPTTLKDLSETLGKETIDSLQHLGHARQLTVLWHIVPETGTRCAIITRDEFSFPKFTRAGTRPTGFEQRIHTGGFRMHKLLSCRYNMDINRVEARFADGSAVAIDCIAMEDEYGNTPAQRAELDWLLYNKPLEYAQLVLGSEIEHYLSLGCDHGRLKD